MAFKSLIAVAAVVAVALLFFCPVEAQNNSVADILQTNGQTNVFFNITNSTNPSLIAVLQGGNNTNATYTVFAPSDSAFTPQLVGLLSSNSNLQSILLYHVANGSHPSSSLQNGANIIDSLANGALLKWSNGTGLPLDVVKGGSSSSGGPPSLATSANNITVFYGLGSVNVIQAEITASNGIVYITDGILSLPQSPSSTVRQTISGAGQLATFGQELNQTNLASTVDTANGVTIFAPSNSAFAHINISGLSNDVLVKILKYHIVNQVYYTTNLTNLALNGPVNITSMQGDNLTITVSGNDMTVGNSNTTAKVVMPNVLIDNGVIHIIDTVLFPTDLYSNTSSNGASSAAPALHGFNLALALPTIAIVAALLI